MKKKVFTTSIIVILILLQVTIVHAISNADDLFQHATNTAKDYLEDERGELEELEKFYNSGKENDAINQETQNDIEKEEFKNAIKKVVENTEDYSSTINDEEVKVTNISDTQIEFNNKYKVDYDFTNHPTFEVEITVTNTMTYEQWNDEVMKFGIFEYPFNAIADIKGEDSKMYFMMNVVKKSLECTEELLEENFKSENAIEKTKSLYKKMNTNDKLYTLIFEKIEETTNTYKVKAIMEVNEDADFSIANIKENEDIANLGNTINNTLNTMNNNISGIDEIPQTGKTFQFLDLLWGILIIAIAIFISYGMYNKKQMEK